MKPRVLILHTGGTLGMRPREPDRALAPDEFGPALLQQMPELGEIAEVETRVLFRLDSSDVTPKEWMALAAAIAESVPGYNGVVITHGTDAMAYTASALSFVLRNLPIPVILTGAQRPLVDARSDARGNVVGAVDLATRDLPEVMIYFDGQLLRGNRATKSSSFAFGAFSSPNFPPLAEVGTGVRITGRTLRPKGKFRVEGAFDPAVAALRLVPAQRPEPLMALRGGAIRAVLIQAFGVGNIPVVDSGVAGAIGELTSEGKVVAICAQPLHGTVTLEAYEGGRRAAAVGAVDTADMTVEAAVVKLMYLLGVCRDAAEVRSRLRTPIAGEITPQG